MSSVRVRMFRQGLGDCFLLTFPGKEREVHVLIDFGVLLGTGNAKETMQKTAQQIVAATGGHLDVLVATHEHWDHVSGFSQAEQFLGPDKLQVDTVWVAWTEKPGDSLAEELGKRREKALQRIVAGTHHLAGLDDIGAHQTAERLTGLLEFWGGLGAAGRGTTRSSLEWVKTRTNPKPPEYLEPGMDPFAIPGVEGVRVYVLGPPRDAKLLKKNNPSSRASEVYELAAETDSAFGFFSALDALDNGSAPSEQPFQDWFRVSEAEARKQDFFRQRYGFEGEDSRRIEHDWLGATGPLALQLDSDTNNTSLALAFELGDSGRVLLFPADAQVGNWLSWQKLEWKIGQGEAAKKVKAADLLARTVLYKVGHHGSHNATLRELGLELMTHDELTAMLPVDRDTAKKMKWNMPFPSLYTRLLERTKGRILDLQEGMPASKPEALSAAEWNRFRASTDVQDDWIDYRVAR